jgi:hypothetical protein
MENNIRLLYKQKLELVNEKEYFARNEQASALWRADPEVKKKLEELGKIADGINDNFLEYTLSDFTLLFFHFIGLHEETFFREGDGSHALSDLLNKPQGYSFNSTMSFVSNRFEEMMSGKDVYQNLDRIEMSCAYLLIFLSRLLYSPYIPAKVRDIGLYRDTLDLTMESFIRSNISISQISLEKQGLMRELALCSRDIKDNTLSKGQWVSLIDLTLRNFGNLMTISSFLKNEVYLDGWHVLRPSFFELCKENWCSKCFPCRYYEGPICSPEFPYESIKPKHFEMYG